MSSWTTPQYVFQNLAITQTGCVQSGTIALDTMYTNHMVAFSFSAPAPPGNTFTLTLYGWLTGEQPGCVPYTLGSIESNTIQNTTPGSWTQGCYNVGYLLVQQGVPAAFLLVDINVTSYTGPAYGNVSVTSSNLGL